MLVGAGCWVLGAWLSAGAGERWWILVLPQGSGSAWASDERRLGLEMQSAAGMQGANCAS